MDEQRRKSFPASALAALAYRFQLLMHPVHDHEELQDDPVHAEGQQHEDRVDDDQREEPAGGAAVLEAEAKEDSAQITVQMVMRT